MENSWLKNYAIDLKAYKSDPEKKIKTKPLEKLILKIQIFGCFGPILPIFR